MITTIAVIAAIAEKKKRSQRSVAIIWNHSQAIAATTIAGDRCRCDRWRVVSIWSLNFFFSAIAAITAIVAIIWKPGLIYRNNHPPFLLNCYLYALQTYRTHSSKLRLILVNIGFKTFTHKLRNLSDPAEGKQASFPLNSESYRAVLPRKKDCSSVKLRLRKFVFGLGSARSVSRFLRLWLMLLSLSFVRGC